MYDKKLLAELLSQIEHKTINDVGNILPPSSAVYNNISAAMLQGGSSINAKHISKSKLKGYLYEKPRKKIHAVFEGICKIFSHQLYI